MEFKNQYDLAKISTTIGTLARGQKWGQHDYTKNSTKEFAVHEVQCAFFEDEDRIFIAANEKQHAQILTALNTCGVRNIADLTELLKKAHKLFELSADNLNDIGIKHSYSSQDTTAYQLVHTKNSSYNVAALTGDETTKVKLILSLSATATLPSTLEAKDVFLYKKLSGKKVSPNITMPAGTLRLVKAPSNVRDQTINIIENNEPAHAELAILKFLTRGITEGTFTKSTIFLGGRKMACANCKTWIEKYREVLTTGITLHTPDDTRTETQTNPGTCPSAFEPALAETSPSKIKTTHVYFPVLFSGDLISGITWPALPVEPVVEE